MSLKDISAPTELLGTLLGTTDNIFEPRHWLIEDVLILSPPLELLWPRLISLLTNVVSSDEDISSWNKSSSSDQATCPIYKQIMNFWAQYPYNNILELVVLRSNTQKFSLLSSPLFSFLIAYNYLCLSLSLSLSLSL